MDRWNVSEIVPGATDLELWSRALFPGRLRAANEGPGMATPPAKPRPWPAALGLPGGEGEAG